MEINQLRDLIFDCFTEYRYWSFQALKARTAQPDAHLRDVLKEVAILETTGDYSRECW
jgi:transcription initiation factor TFIIF subunit beta